jgi:hypothetical protein
MMYIDPFFHEPDPDSEPIENDNERFEHFLETMPGGLSKAEKTLEKESSFIKICRTIQSVKEYEQLKATWKMIELYESKYERSQYLRVKYIKKFDKLEGQII